MVDHATKELNLHDVAGRVGVLEQAVDQLQENVFANWPSMRRVPRNAGPDPVLEELNAANITIGDLRQQLAAAKTLIAERAAPRAATDCELMALGSIAQERFTRIGALEGEVNTAHKANEELRMQLADYAALANERLNTMAALNQDLRDQKIVIAERDAMLAEAQASIKDLTAAFRGAVNKREAVEQELELAERRQSKELGNALQTRNHYKATAESLSAKLAKLRPLRAKLTEAHALLSEV